jgi:putative acetyltransferase
MNADPKIRFATNDDCDGIVALVDEVLQEYGDRICLAEGGAECDLLDIRDGYLKKGGQFWVLEQPSPTGQKEIVGTHAARPDPSKEGVCTFKRLYLHRDLRGSTWGRELMQVTIDWAKAKRFQRIEFWSDTRFERAHHFFLKFGFVRSGETRHMTDSAIPYSEYQFHLDLSTDLDLNTNLDLEIT